MGQTAHEQLLGEYEVRAESYDEHASHGFIQSEGLLLRR
jgi:hypothetical protein